MRLRQTGSDVCQLSYRRRQIGIDADWKTDKQTQVWTSTHVRSTYIRTHQTSVGGVSYETWWGGYVIWFFRAERCAVWLIERQRHSLLYLWHSNPSLLFRHFILVTFFSRFLPYFDFNVWNSMASLHYNSFAREMLRWSEVKVVLQGHCLKEMWVSKAHYHATVTCADNVYICGHCVSSLLTVMCLRCEQSLIISADADHRVSVETIRYQVLIWRSFCYFWRD